MAAVQMPSPAAKWRATNAAAPPKAPPEAPPTSPEEMPPDPVEPSHDSPETEEPVEYPDEIPPFEERYETAGVFSPDGASPCHIPA